MIYYVFKGLFLRVALSGNLHRFKQYLSLLAYQLASKMKFHECWGNTENHSNWHMSGLFVVSQFHDAICVS